MAIFVFFPCLESKIREFSSLTEIYVNPSKVASLDSPEHLDLIRRVALTVWLAGLDRPDRLGLRSIVDREVWSEGEKLADRSGRSATAGRLSPSPNVSLGWS